MQLYSPLGMGIVRPIVYLGTKGDNGGIESIDCILETELTTGELHLLSEIIQQRVITLTEEHTGTLLVLTSKIGLGGSTGDAQVVEVAASGLKPVTYLTKRYAVGELAEYHTHKVTPCVETLGMFVRAMLFYQ